MAVLLVILVINNNLESLSMEVVQVVNDLYALHLLLSVNSINIGI